MICSSVAGASDLHPALKFLHGTARGPDLYIKFCGSSVLPVGESHSARARL